MDNRGGHGDVVRETRELSVIMEPSWVWAVMWEPSAPSQQTPTPAQCQSFPQKHQYSPPRIAWGSRAHIVSLPLCLSLADHSHH